MDISDRVEREDIQGVGREVARMRRRSVAVALGGGILFSASVSVGWLWLHPGTAQVAAFLAVASYLAFGVPLLVFWIRHWRNIERKLADVAARVESGEIVYGSQVKFR